MTARLESLTRPSPSDDYRGNTRHRSIGFGLGLVGLLLATVTLIANLAAAAGVETDPVSAAETLAWSFGLTTVAFATIKVAIALVLVGILVRLWWRVESVKASLATLRSPSPGAGRGAGTLETLYGPATLTATTPPPLPVHTMAKTMWFPMLAMGAMAVLIGFIASLVWAGDTTSQAAAAWTQGLQFLGEGMILSGIAFLLGSILAGLRSGGGEVQETLGLPVTTLKMPTTAKLFVVLMAMGLMVSIAQFILYLAASGAPGATGFAAWSAWLGPFRELGLGLILAGIVMALVTIGNVLGFQFSRIRDIITTGQ